MPKLEHLEWIARTLPKAYFLVMAMSYISATFVSAFQMEVCETFCEDHRLSSFSIAMRIAVIVGANKKRKLTKYFTTV